MDNYENSIFVVEGTTDVNFLQNFIKSEFVITNGSEVSRETIEYLKVASKLKKIIVMTDPDAPGLRIRSIIENAIPGVSHVYVERQQCIGRHKLGIAESNRQAVQEALRNIVPSKATKRGTLTSSQLISLGLIGEREAKIKRDNISKIFHLGVPNGKTFLYRLNSLGITYDELKKMVEESNI
ncbi:MAG TPA: ribonuclease M5 [Bacilli bacterium]|nr:ribonuclease M5 [Bacilli bacterium]